jgi:hypothetical protein
MNFDEWIKMGYDLGYCTPPVCATHDGVPSTATEDEQWDQGDEACIHVVRVHNTIEEKKSVEANYSPAVWRATELGWI